MRPDCQLRAFNAEVTDSPTMVLLPCSHNCPPTLVPLFGNDREGYGGWRTALSSQGTNSPRTWWSSAISSSSFSSSLVILGRFPPRLGPWAYYSKWAGVPRSFGPTHTLLFEIFLILHPKVSEFGFYTLKFHTILIVNPSISFMLTCLLSAT